MSTTQNRNHIDLNADLGEGFGRWSLGDDDALLELITSANVACGFHAGDPTITRRVCAGGCEHGVALGAQVSYRELAGFGRRPMSMPADELTNDIVYQIGGLDACARAEGTSVSYVKPHGALNNVSAQDPEQARSIVDAVRIVDVGLPLLVLPGTELEAQAVQAGLPTAREAFPDRAYEANGFLGSRRLPDAVLHDVDEITRRAVDLARRRVVTAYDGTVVALDADSLCLHGDNDEAVGAARSIVAGLRNAGVDLARFTGSP